MGTVFIALIMSKCNKLPLDKNSISLMDLKPIENEPNGASSTSGGFLRSYSSNVPVYNKSSRKTDCALNIVRQFNSIRFNRTMLFSYAGPHKPVCNFSFPVFVGLSYPYFYCNESTYKDSLKFYRSEKNVSHLRHEDFSTRQSHYMLDLE